MVVVVGFGGVRHGSFRRSDEVAMEGVGESKRGIGKERQQVRINENAGRASYSSDSAAPRCSLSAVILTIDYTKGL